MATASRTDDSPSGDDSWVTILKQKARHTLSLCRVVQTSSPIEAEYAELLAEILEKLSSWWALSPCQIWNPEEWNEEATNFLSRLDAKLDPDGWFRDGSPIEGTTLRWQLTSDEMTEFVNAFDELKGRHRLKPLNSDDGDHELPSAPPRLYIYTLEYIRDRLLPPPEIGSWVDISRLRRWLDHCDGHHSVHCQFSSRSKEVFKYRPRWLIDLKRMCLVPSESTHRYVALSYVWGVGTAFKTLKRNIHRLQDKDSLQSHDVATVLPTTIRDVIELTRQIGEQFLWVDSLCIVQDDERERHDQLDRMGSIYANAYVTIVAAGGTAFSGLRGIKDATPPMERVPEIPHHLRYSRLRFLHHVIKQSHRKLQASTWNHRAWTFQEQIFSRRLLVFDNTSVIWECHCAVWLEGMEAEEGQCQNNKDMVAQGFSFSVEPSIRDYARHVTEFNRRELSYPEDALDAFGGILATLSTAFVGGFICGLPAMFFDAALLWYGESPLERRHARRLDDDTGGAGTDPMPPSWAWAAWGGAITFPGCEDNVPGDQDDKIRPLVQWSYRACDQEHWESIRTAQGEEEQQIHEGLDQSEVLVVRSSADDSREHDTEEDCVKPPSSTRGITSYVLFARPRRAFFRVMEVIGEVQLLLTDGLDGCAGMLSSCEALTKDKKSLDQLLCEVVVVSESFVNGTDVYNAIWIEWEDGIAYRKGVGRILKSAWEAAKPEKINLILG